MRIGCKIRFHDQTSRDTLIKFMTDGILLAETRADPELLQYDTIILDEAHERSLNIDFLLGYLKRLLARRSDLKLIISSATIDAERFSRHFEGAPVIAIEGRGFPISTEYWAGDRGEEAENSYVDQAVAAVTSLCTPTAPGPDGDILVFMPTERDINDTLDSLKHLESSHLLLPLFGRLPSFIACDETGFESFAEALLSCNASRSCMRQLQPGSCRSDPHPTVSRLPCPLFPVHIRQTRQHRAKAPASSPSVVWGCCFWALPCSVLCSSARFWPGWFR